jgi:hypothetical protein
MTELGRPSDGDVADVLIVGAGPSEGSGLLVQTTAWRSTLRTFDRLQLGRDGV